MRGDDYYGEPTPRFRSVFDCDHHVGDLRHKLRQEEMMGQMLHRTIQWHTDDGDEVFEVDPSGREIRLAGGRLDMSVLPELIAALQAAEKELEAACPKT